MATKTSLPEADVSDLVLTHCDDRGDLGRIAWATCNHPAKRNALGVAGKERFIEVMTGVKHDICIARRRWWVRIGPRHSTAPCSSWVARPSR